MGNPLVEMWRDQLTELVRSISEKESARRTFMNESLRELRALYAAREDLIKKIAAPSATEEANPTLFGGGNE